MAELKIRSEAWGKSKRITELVQDTGAGAYVPIDREGWSEARKVPLSALASTMAGDSLAAFGSGVGLGSEAADTAAFQAWEAQSTKSLFLPELTGSTKYRLGADIRITNDYQWIIGQSWRSRLYLVDDARLIFGEAVTLAGPTKDTSKDVSFNGIRDLSIEGDPRNGELVLLDYLDFFRFKNVFFNVPTLDATKLTHGVKCNWTEWVTFDHVISYVNGYNVYIYLGAVPGDNEDHFTFINCNLFNAKRAVAGSQPSNVFIERVVARADFLAIREFNVFGGHWGKFWSSGGDATAEDNACALSIANQMSTTDVRTLINAQFNGTWFENHARIVDMGTLADHELSTVTLRGVTAMNPGYIAKGSGFSRSNIVCEDMVIENATGSRSFVGCKIYVSGGRNISSFTTPPTADDLASALLWGAPQIRSGGRLWQQGSATVAAGAGSVTVSYNLHTSAHNVTCFPGWATGWYISAYNSTTFTVTFTTPPAVDTVMRWRAETPADRLENTTPSGTAYSGLLGKMNLSPIFARKLSAWSTTPGATPSGSDLGLANSAGSPLVSSAASGATITQFASWFVTMPGDYVAGKPAQVYASAKVSAAPTVSVTLVMELARIANDAVGSNLVSTSAGAVGLAYAQQVYTVNGATLNPGDLVRITVKVVCNDTGGAVGSVVSIAADGVGMNYTAYR